MADLNSIAKQIHNLSPGPVEITLQDGSQAIYQISKAEFFQQEFQAEGTRENDEPRYRFVSSEDNESILIGRKEPDESTWTMVGRIQEIGAVETE
ncbi:transcriptional regulator [Halosimplex pelagicum]|uniref:Transcriptional regulator n=1 Tax=Halosimplex pelagicum TaxID=869886 RepID=A0A7D5P6C4_9EURY|nr:transcriptional regulator [Halosimplex pelagicum]QLH81963.1 transcriptional regulator [Halosimplex pelagicum]